MFWRKCEVKQFCRFSYLRTCLKQNHSYFRQYDLAFSEERMSEEFHKLAEQLESRIDQKVNNGLQELKDILSNKHSEMKNDELRRHQAMASELQTFITDEMNKCSAKMEKAARLSWLRDLIKLVSVETAGCTLRETQAEVCCFETPFEVSATKSSKNELNEAERLTVGGKETVLQACTSKSSASTPKAGEIISDEGAVMILKAPLLSDSDLQATARAKRDIDLDSDGDESTGPQKRPRITETPKSHREPNSSCESDTDADPALLTRKSHKQRLVASVKKSFPKINAALEKLAIKEKFNTQDMKQRVVDTVKESYGGVLPDGTSPDSWFNRYRKLAGFERRYRQFYQKKIVALKGAEDSIVLKEIAEIHQMESPSSKNLPREFGSFVMGKAKKVSIAK